MNGRVWMNDPDVFFLRKDNLKFTDEQKYLLGRINNLCGTVLFVSDNAGDYDESAQNLLKVLFEKTDEKIISAEYTSDEIIKIVTDRETFSFNLKKGKFIDNDNWKKYFN